MESIDVITDGHSQHTESNDIFAAAYKQLESDDEDSDYDWEYEYSKTETETYYLTLDLSTPEVPPTHPPFDDTIRRKTRWLNPSIGRHRRQTPMPPANRTAKTYTLDDRRSPIENGDAEKVSEDEGGRPMALDPDENSTEPKSVQILDLESHLPLVAFDGHVYACSWAENIGTEFLFTPSDVDNVSQLPKLRTLQGNVDLLACSSARLVAKSVKLTPLQNIPQNIAKPRGRDKALIPVGHAASQQRKNQAHFLEKLILAKEKRGELDCVTVNAKPRLPPRKLRALFEEKRSQERARLSKEISRISASAEEKDKAKSRLDEMDREDMEWSNRGESYAKAGRNGGRPKKVPFGLGGGKIAKSTLWSQRNNKGKGKLSDKAHSMSSESPAGRKNGHLASFQSETAFNGDENLLEIDDKRYGKYHNTLNEETFDEELYDIDDEMIYGDDDAPAEDDDIEMLA